ncbi:CPBP family intramembrane metalloprotease [Hoyosella rhizosphaerae]|uniref:CAAX prenyl protease 2/Lysostaphin resistance protein A-like domain-containing protein n=1 Tax=Hoyosella rhizosphaerae TaxID=1755582 RepID=A0A916XHG6_9ACTN|nr:CPBP family intramembrane glutamic endopeptidase [Hoyosella rhizosphaerae]MBN4928259.1 CPBP family intramembrane metalloprotease [Hoyosella rhizosphaerae]GGC73612.1 hypothetical protein GCM10011410_28460 [Hoyosella rhizosphaerae]
MTRVAFATAVAASAAALTWNNIVVPRQQWGWRTRTITHAGVGIGAVLCARAAGVTSRELHVDTAMKLRPRYQVAAGIAASGLAAAAVVSTGIASRSGDRGTTPQPEPERPLAEWVLFHIPLGTVVAEELLFRATINALWWRALPDPWSRTVGAAVFGLWHIAPAGGWGAGGSRVVATVGATALAGVGFTALTKRYDSVLAAALVHYVVNAGGAVIAHVSSLES